MTGALAVDCQDQFRTLVFPAVGTLVDGTQNYTLEEEITPGVLAVKMVHYAARAYEALVADPVTSRSRQVLPGHLVLGLLYQVRP